MVLLLNLRSAEDSSKLTAMDLEPEGMRCKDTSSIQGTLIRQEGL